MIDWVWSLFDNGRGVRFVALMVLLGGIFAYERFDDFRDERRQESLQQLTVNEFLFAEVRRLSVEIAELRGQREGEALRPSPRAREPPDLSRSFHGFAPERAGRPGPAK